MAKTRDHNESSKTRRPDPYQEQARALASAAGLDPDARIERPGARSMPTWCTFLDAARHAAIAEARQEPVAQIAPQSAAFANSPLKIFGRHDQKTVDQMRACMEVGSRPNLSPMGCPATWPNSRLAASSGRKPGRSRAVPSEWRLMRQNRGTLDRHWPAIYSSAR